jgi:acyl dehydratase
MPTTGPSFDGRLTDTWLMDDEVSQAAIRLWCEVLEDANPLYHDADFAAASGHGGIVAPPAMILTWCTRPEWTPQGALSSISDDLRDSLPDLPNAVSLGSVQQHARLLRVGERLTIRRYESAPSPEKLTPRGLGRIVTVYHSMQDDSGVEVASLELEILRFRASEHGAGEEPLPPIPNDLVAHSSGSASSSVAERARRSRDVDVGVALAPLSMPLTLKRCIKWVAASRDYNEVHHDRDFARATGAPDLFIGVHFFHGLVGRYVTDWTGPSGEMRRMEFRSWGRCFPGETVQLTGRIARKHLDGDDTFFDLEVVCGNERGRVHDATVTVFVPDA